jgi:hypothetical protein
VTLTLGARRSCRDPNSSRLRPTTPLVRDLAAQLISSRVLILISHYIFTALTTDAQLLAWLGNQLPSAISSAITALIRFYPPTQSYGSPYNTGNVKYLFQQFKRASSLFGDLAFEAPRRALLAAANRWSGVDGAEMPVWSYQFSERSRGEAEYLGGESLDEWEREKALPSTELTLSSNYYQSHTELRSPGSGRRLIPPVPSSLLCATE